MATPFKWNFICFACKNFINENDGKKYCKAFGDGKGIPPNMNTYNVEQHSITSRTQANDYILEPLEKYSNYAKYKKYISYQKLYDPPIPPKLNNYRLFDLELYVGNFDTYLFYLVPNKWLSNIEQLAPSIRDLLSVYNQGATAKKLKVSLESKNETRIKKALDSIKKDGTPDDLIPNPLHFDALKYNSAEQYYTMGFLQALLYVEELNLNNFKIQELSSDIFYLTKAKYLYISNNELTKLPDSIGYLHSLLRLDLYGNKLTNLPKTISGLQNLRRLDLYYNHFQSLPAYLGDLQNLQSLGLNHNQLSSLPNSFSALSNLERLYLTHNQLGDFPSQVCSLSSLKYLYLSDNQITTLPPEIAGVKNLRWLSLANNQLTTIPEEISELSKLEWLNISGNPLPEKEKERLKGYLPGVEIVW